MMIIYRLIWPYKQKDARVFLERVEIIAPSKDKETKIQT